MTRWWVGWLALLVLIVGVVVTLISGPTDSMGAPPKGSLARPILTERALYGTPTPYLSPAYLTSVASK